MTAWQPEQLTTVQYIFIAVISTTRSSCFAENTTQEMEPGLTGAMLRELQALQDSYMSYSWDAQTSAWLSDRLCRHRRYYVITKLVLR